MRRPERLRPWAPGTEARGPGCRPSGRSDGQQAPRARDPGEAVRPPVLVADPGPGHQVPDGAGDQHLPGPAVAARATLDRRGAEVVLLLLLGIAGLALGAGVGRWAVLWLPVGLGGVALAAGVVAGAPRRADTPLPFLV